MLCLLLASIMTPSGADVFDEGIMLQAGQQDKKQQMPAVAKLINPPPPLADPYDVYPVMLNILALSPCLWYQQCLHAVNM